MHPEVFAALAVLDRRLGTLLPPEYQQIWDTVEPVSMGSAGLKYDADGRVAWDAIWKTFCDLAMAGGPPHRGTLLVPGSPAAIDADPVRYDAAVAEICRGVRMVTGLEVAASPHRGWVRVQCADATMAGWLLRAVVMENVSARADGSTLDVPAGPGFRVEKEIKNVVTTMAKSCHYWVGHTPPDQQLAVGRLFAELAAQSPLIVPATGAGAGAGADADANADADADGDASGDASGDDCAARARAIADGIHRETGLTVAEYTGHAWLAVECPGVRTAVWMMRALVASNVLARREDTRLCVPVPAADEEGAEVVSRLARVRRLALARGLT